MSKAVAKRNVKAVAKRTKTPVAKIAPGALKTFGDAILARYPKADTGEVQLLFLMAKRMGLDPLSNHLYLVPRWNNELGRETSTVQVGIDALRLAADRTKNYAGCAAVTFNDGKTMDQMIAAGEKYPRTARSIGYKVVGGIKVEVVAEVTWDSRAQYYNNALTKFWANDPYGMLAKCSDALMLRKGWPLVNSDAYIPEEMPARDVTPQPSEKDIKKIEGKAKALPAPGDVATSPRQQQQEEAMPEAWSKANRALHAEASRLGMDVNGLHAYIHAKEKVDSLRKLTALKVANWVQIMREIEPGTEAHTEAVQRTVDALKRQ